MPDTLRTLVRKFDRENARTHRLTGEAVMPPRSGVSTRRVCGSCWHVVDEHEEFRKWEAETRVKCGCLDLDDAPVLNFRFGHWQGATQRYVMHEYPGVTVCPRCGADALGEVVRG